MGERERWKRGRIKVEERKNKSGREGEKRRRKWKRW